MNRYLFVFGYETPDQFGYNNECGTDDEDSLAFFLDAEDESAADPDASARRQRPDGLQESPRRLRLR
jgi:hypothetical protein